MEILYRIESNYFTCGIIIENNLVIRTAPIVNYMLNWNLFKVLLYCKKKNFKIIKL